MRISCGCNKALAGMRGLGAGEPTQTQLFANPNNLPVSCNTAGGYSWQQPSCYMVAQCMTASDYKAAQAQCNAIPNTAGTVANNNTNNAAATLLAIQQDPLNPNPPLTGSPQVCNTPQCLADMTQLNQTLATGGNLVGGGNPGAVSTSDIMLGTVDVTTLLSTYGIWIAAGAAALFLLNRK